MRAARLGRGLLTCGANLRIRAVTFTEFCRKVWSPEVPHWCLRNKSSFQEGLCTAVQQQKLLSSPSFGAFKAYLIKGILLRSSVYYADTGIVLVS